LCLKSGTDDSTGAFDRVGHLLGRSEGRTPVAPAKLEIAPKASSFEIDVWYENVGDRPRIVPVHKSKDRADGSLIMLEGTYDRILKFRFPFRLPQPSRNRATSRAALSEERTLPSGERFKERFRLHFAGGKIPDGIDFWQLPALSPGKSMVLQVVYPQVQDPKAKFDAAVERKSGGITVTRAAEADADKDVSWGEAEGGVRLDLSADLLLFFLPFRRAFEMTNVVRSQIAALKI
jgi:hypothetical protein